ncbi:putative amino acid transporter [Meredithblackwellia eburnea MCA 4105]
MGGTEFDIEKAGDSTKPDVSGSIHTADGGIVLHGMDNQSGEGVVQRKLKARHLQMIALGGTIGTGLFVGAGGALATGGPLGVLLGYSIMGAVVWTMMIALGEMTTLYPVSGSFTHYASRFVDPALGFALGWNYYYSWATTIAAEISAASLVIDYWPGGADINPAAWVTLFFGVIVAFNFIGVRAYGEAEFIFSVIKIIAIVGLIILGVIITCGGGPNHETIGFRFWRADGPFQQLNGIPGPFGRFLSFWTVFVQAAFSFLGTEIVALTAGEAENPRRNMPRAIKKVFFRIALFYVFGVFVMGLLVSPNDPNLLNGSGTAASPWVIAIENAGIKALPSIINVVVLLAAFSAGNSDVYASSRMLYGLACSSQAPAIFRRCTKNGVPIYALLVTCLFGFLAYMTCGTASASTVFSWLYNLGAITGLIAWAVILLSYIRFYNGLRRQGISRDNFPYRAPFQPYASYFGLIFMILVIIFNGYTLFLRDSWSTASFIVDYITLPIFAILYVAWKLVKKTKIVPLDRMDFQTGRRELEMVSENDEAKYAAPKNFWARAWDAIM